MFDEIEDMFSDQEAEDLRMRKLLDMVCEGVEVPSDAEVEETLDWQDA